MEALVPTVALTQLRFAAAGEAWLESRRPYISEKTHHEYKLNIKTLAAFFGELRLQEIDGDLVRAFQKMRMQKCGAFAINHECGLLCQIRKRIGIPLLDYQPLPLPKEMRGQVLGDEQRERLFRVGAENPNWEAIYALALISINTTANPKEVYSRKLEDLDLEARVLRISGSKNKYRLRWVPLNDEALKGGAIALKRARSLGAVRPEHYLFPKRVNGDTYDPTHHQTTFKTAWAKWRTVAQIPKTFRIEDFRHHALTELYQDPRVSDETIEQIGGHHDRKMRKFYSHIRMERKREAVEGLAMKKKPARNRRSEPGETKKETKNRDQLINQIASLLTQLLKTG